MALSTPWLSMAAVEMPRLFSVCSICQTPSRFSRSCTPSVMRTSNEPSGWGTIRTGAGFSSGCAISFGSSGGAGFWPDQTESFASMAGSHCSRNVCLNLGHSFASPWPSATRRGTMSEMKPLIAPSVMA